jgi:hypothetical protein
VKEVIDIWGDALIEYAQLIELDSNYGDPLNEGRQVISLARFYIEMALEKYKQTNNSQAIFK